MPPPKITKSAHVHNVPKNTHILVTLLLTDSYANIAHYIILSFFAVKIELIWFRCYHLFGFTLMFLLPSFAISSCNLDFPSQIIFVI